MGAVGSPAAVSQSGAALIPGPNEQLPGTPMTRRRAKWTAAAGTDAGNFCEGG